MFLYLLFATFVVALAVSFFVMRLFTKPVDSVLRRIIADEISAAWSKYMKFAILVVGVSAGVRVPEDGEELVFVEVKCRTTPACGDPLEAVTPFKRRRILRAAALYLHATGSWERPCRFDIVAVRLGPDGSAEVEHLPAAFQAES